MRIKDVKALNTSSLWPDRPLIPKVEINVTTARAAVSLQEEGGVTLTQGQWRDKGNTKA